MLIKNFQVDTQEAIQIHQAAYQNALDKVKDPNKVAADNIAEELAKLLTPFFKTLDLDHNFQTYYYILSKWTASEEVAENQFRCAQVQHVACSLLNEQNLLNKYKEISNDYNTHLKNSMLTEIKNLTNKDTLEKIYKMIMNKGIGSAKPLEGSTIADIKNKICTYLQNQTANNELINRLDNSGLFSPNTIGAMKKHGVITKAIDILNNSEENPIKFKNFYAHLKQYKKVLMTIRDNKFTTFIKGLGVMASTIFGFGIGGFFAYRELFHKSHGIKYLDKIDQMQTSGLKPR